MPYSKEAAYHAEQVLQERRERAITEWEAHTAELKTSLPEAYDIDCRLRSAGIRIYSAIRGEDPDGMTVDQIKKEAVALTAELRAQLIKNGYPDNYLDVNYYCPKCSDTGYIGLDMCDCMKALLAEKAFEESGLSHLSSLQSFDNFDLSYYSGDDRLKMEKNVSKLKAFSENFKSRSGENWLLYGPTGLGKTHLSTAVASNVIKSGASVVYDTAQQIIFAFEERRFGRDYDSDGGRKYSDCDLLIIDDLGVEVVNQFSVSCLYSVINDRLVKRRSTIINTNLERAQIREKYTDRIASRLFGEYMPLFFSGTDVRRQKIERQIK